MQTEQKKEYDRQYARDRYAEFRAEKDHVCLDLLGGQCFICGATENANEYHLHHVYYHPTESNYATHSSNQWVRSQRVREALEHPERFRLLCATCHRSVTFVATGILRRTRKHNVPEDALPTLIELVLIEIRNRKK